MLYTCKILCYSSGKKISRVRVPDACPGRRVGRHTRFVCRGRPQSQDSMENREENGALKSSSKTTVHLHSYPIAPRARARGPLRGSPCSPSPGAPTPRQAGSPAPQPQHSWWEARARAAPRVSEIPRSRRPHPRPATEHHPRLSSVEAGASPRLGSPTNAGFGAKPGAKSVCGEQVTGCPVRTGAGDYGAASTT